MAKKKNSTLWIIALIVLGYLVYKQGGIFLGAFENPANNIMPNPSVEEWVAGDASTVIKVPIGWNHGGWSHGEMWEDLIQSSIIVHSGAYSAGFINKGYDGSVDVSSPCDDWCFWYTSITPITSGSLVNIRYYFYPVSFQQIVGSAGVQVRVVWLDSSQTAIGDSISIGDLMQSDFTPANVWKERIWSGTSPATAKYVRLLFRLNTDPDPQFVTTFYIDDLWIESAGCIGGTTKNCGIDTGVCEFGVSTCTSNVWSSCVGGINPVTEVCGDSLDNNCNGATDEGCGVFVPYTNAELQTKFDAINLAYHGGQGTSDSNSPTYWTWDNTPIVEGYLNMYLATGNTKYLDSAVSNTDRIISKSSIDPINLATGGTLSPWKGWYTLEHPIDPILTYSRIVFPMIKFVYIVKKNNLQSYMAKADSYLAFVQDNVIPRYDTIWHECGTMGFWTEGTASAPNNRASFVGRIHLYMWLITGESRYYDQSVKYATKIKSTLLEKSDGPTGATYYFWNYANKAGCKTVGSAYQCSVECAAETRNECVTNPSAWTCSGPLEAGYGNYDAMLMIDYYEAGIVFTSADITKLANTFKEALLVTTTLVGETTTDLRSQLTVRWDAQPRSAQPHDTSDSHGYYAFAGGTHHWARLGHYDASIKDTFDRINRWILDDAVAEGTNYNHAYNCVVDTRGTYGAICITSATPGWEDDLRSTPAYSTSRIGHQLLSSEHLTPLTPTCTAETNAAFCTRLGKVCGQVTANDNCGTSRTVTSCGTCTSPATCVSNQCSTPTCTPNWQIGAWSTCSGGTQTRTVTDSNNCGVTTGKPAESQSCTAVCVENWQCTGWTTCSSGQKNRLCLDANFCGVTTNKPAESQSCTATTTTTAACTPTWDCTGWSSWSEDKDCGDRTRLCIDTHICSNNTGKPTVTESKECPEGAGYGLLIILAVAGYFIFKSEKFKQFIKKKK